MGGSCGEVTGPNIVLYVKVLAHVIANVFLDTPLPAIGKFLRF
jgi:hypothetical protein